MQAEPGSLVHTIQNAVVQLQAMYPQEPSRPVGQAIVGFVVGIVALGGLFYLLERLFPEQPGQKILHRGSRPNLAFLLFDAVIAQRIVGLAIVVMLIAAVALEIPRASFLASQPIGLQAIEAILVASLFGYWAHRLTHTIPFLWRFHKVHHSSEQLDWLAAGRVHPVDSVWNRVWTILPLFLLGFSPGITAVFGPFFAVYPIFIHANVSWGYGPLGYVIASPKFHRWHHSSDAAARDKNFSGLLPLYDYLFGTAYFPKEGRPERYGLVEEATPPTFWRQLAWPFSRERGPLQSEKGAA